MPRTQGLQRKANLNCSSKKCVNTIGLYNLNGLMKMLAMLDDVVILSYF
jgi:hypothetical protein